MLLALFADLHPDTGPDVLDILAAVHFAITSNENLIHRLLLIYVTLHCTAIGEGMLRECIHF